MNNADFEQFKEDIWNDYQVKHMKFPVTGEQCINAGTSVHGKANPRYLFESAWGLLCRKCTRFELKRMLGDDPTDTANLLKIIQGSFVNDCCDKVYTACSCEPSDIPSS